MSFKIYVNDKRIWATLLIILLIGLSWFENIDKHADKYLDASIVQAGTAYAAARGINALVSMLQTSTVGGSFYVTASVGIGEILDPINDLIERFSSVMVVAFGSLVLQKILLVIVAHEFFNSAITFLGVMLIIMIYMNKDGFLKTALRLFILFSFVRFSLGFVVLLNGGVDYVFLDSQIVSGNENLDSFKTDLSKINKSDFMKIDTADLSQLKTSDFIESKDYIYVDTKKIEMLNKSIEDSESDIERLEQEVIPKLVSELKEAQAKVADSEDVVQNLEKENIWSMFGINESQEVKEAKELLSRYVGARDDLLNEISDKELKVENIQDDISSMREDLANESDGTISAYMKAKVGDVIDLLVLFVLKTVLIPLLFFYVLVKGAKGIWGVNLAKVFAENNQVAMTAA